MNITFHSDEYNHLKFDIKDVNLSIANGIRRILMSEVPSLSIDIDNINIKNNTSIFHNEYVKERLALVPIKYFDKISTETESYSFIDVIKMNNIKCSLKVENKTEDIIEVTTKDIKIELKTIIDDMPIYLDINEKLFNEPHILLLQLKPKEKFECTMEISEGIAGRYSLNKSLKTNNARWQTCTNVGFYHDINSYFYDLETCGVYNNKTILYMAIETLIKKLENFIKNIQNKSDDTRIKSVPNVENMYNVIINKENHTLGNILVELLYKDENVEFCSYKQPHPLEDIIVLQIKSSNNLIDFMVEKCNECVESVKLLLNEINDETIERKLL